MGKVKSPSSKEEQLQASSANTAETNNQSSASTGFDPDQALANAEEFVSKNGKLVLYAAAGILLVIAAIVGGRIYLSNQDKEAQTAMFQAQFYFEADSLAKALDGDGKKAGFIDIVENYPFTRSSATASFYAGLIYLRQGNFDEAIEYLKKYNNKDLILQARAYALVGDAYMEKGEFEDAASYYEKASDFEPNKQFTPEFLMKWALALEKLGNNKEAIKCYDKIIVKYPNAQKVNDAKRYKGMLEALSE